MLCVGSADDACGGWNSTQPNVAYFEVQNVFNRINPLSHAYEWKISFPGHFSSFMSFIFYSINPAISNKIHFLHI